MHPNVLSDSVSAWRDVREGFVVASGGNAFNGDGCAARGGVVDDDRMDCPEAESPIGACGRSEYVLLVEEDAGMQNALAALLSSWEFDVRIAFDGASALQMWRACPIEARPDLILADVSGAQGRELLRVVRDEEPLLPIVLMTAFPSQAPLIDALRLRVDDFLVKPITAVELKNVLDRALERRRKRSACDQEEARAARLQAVLETAIAVNHEINNPLATISASAQLLRHHLQLPPSPSKVAMLKEATDDKSDRDAIADCASADTPLISSEASVAARMEAADAAVMQHLLDVIIEQCDRIACFNRKLNQVVNPVTRYTGGQKMLDVDLSHNR